MRARCTGASPVRCRPRHLSGRAFVDDRLDRGLQPAAGGGVARLGELLDGQQPPTDEKAAPEDVEPCRAPLAIRRSQPAGQGLDGLLLEQLDTRRVRLGVARREDQHRQWARSVLCAQEEGHHGLTEPAPVYLEQRGDIEHLLQCLPVQPLLRAEVATDERGIHPGQFRDVPYARVGEAPRGEQGPRGGDQGGSCALGVSLARRWLGVGWAGCVHGCLLTTGIALSPVMYTAVYIARLSSRKDVGGGTR